MLNKFNKIIANRIMSDEIRDNFIISRKFKNNRILIDEVDYYSLPDLIFIKELEQLLLLIGFKRCQN